MEEGGVTAVRDTMNFIHTLFFLLFTVDNGYYFPFSKRYREKRDSAVSLIKGNGAGADSRRRKDPVLLLPWWKEILGTIVFCIAATTYIVRKFFHPPAPVAYVRVRPQKQSKTLMLTVTAGGSFICYEEIRPIYKNNV